MRMRSKGGANGGLHPLNRLLSVLGHGHFGPRGDEDIRPPGRVIQTVLGQEDAASAEVRRGLSRGQGKRLPWRRGGDELAVKATPQSGPVAGIAGQSVKTLPLPMLRRRSRPRLASC